MKFIKFLFCFFIINLLFSLIIFGETRKDDNNKWIEQPLSFIVSKKNGETYILKNIITGEKITDVYETVNGIRKKLNVEEALDRLNKTQKLELNENLNKNNNIKNYDIGYVENYFKVTSGPNKINGNPEKISYDVKGPASIEISKRQEVTFSESFSSNVTYSMKQALRLGAGIKWVKSATRAVSIIHQIPSGEIGCVVFEPYYYEVIGDYITEVTGIILNSKQVSARTPITLSKGVCDGLEYVLLK